MEHAADETQGCQSAGCYRKCRASPSLFVSSDNRFAHGSVPSLRRWKDGMKSKQHKVDVGSVNRHKRPLAGCKIDDSSKPEVVEAQDDSRLVQYGATAY